MLKATISTKFQSFKTPHLRGGLKMLHKSTSGLNLNYYAAMKNTLFAAFLIITSAAAHAQNMKPIASAKPTGKFPELSRVLAEDDTDQIPYTVGRFTCHNFAKTLYLQRSSAVRDLAPYRIEAIKEDWGNDIVRNEKSKKLPIFILTMWNVESGFYHSINAVLTILDKPYNLDSYVFVESQTDEIFATSKEMYRHYEHYLKLGKTLQINISNFTGFVNNGYINQSHDELILHDEVTF
jgi:hypothetical protein